MAWQIKGHSKIFFAIDFLLLIKIISSDPIVNPVLKENPLSLLEGR
jgi:hypothetical protein